MPAWLLAVLALVAGLLVRRRLRRSRRRHEEAPEVTDATVRQIEATGRVETDGAEPLDHERIRAEEDRFWAETWDEPEPLWE